MISVQEAMDRIGALLRPVASEEVDLIDAVGRVLATDAVAARAQPPFAASAMDGYAVRAADLQDGTRLTVVGHIAAGTMADRGIGSGEAMRIFTGAPVPAGADHILIQEDATVDGHAIIVGQNRDKSDYVRPAGHDFSENFRLTAPRRLSHADIALLAAMNCPTVAVAKRPVVALIPTGDELVWPGETPRDDQIVASNNFGLASMFRAAGADVRLMPIARDEPRALAATLDLAAGADLIVTLGGASVGDHDLVSEVAQGQGLDLSFYKLAMRPGKPLMAGRLNDAVMIGLPGNPVSSMVCGAIFVKPALAALQGLPYEHPECHSARLGCDIGTNGPRAHYMRAKIDAAGQEIIPAARQDSALLSVLSQSNALLIRPPHDAARKAGDSVRYCRFD